MAPKTKETTEQNEQTAIKNLVKNVGKALLFVGDEGYAPGDEFEVSDELLKSQGVKHLFGTGQIEFVDDSKRTREFVEEFKQASKPAPKQPVEDGGEIK